MARPSASKIDEELKKQDENFGEEIAGEDESYTDIDESMKKVTGNAPKLNQSANIAREVDQDEEALVHGEEVDTDEASEETTEEVPEGFHVEE